MSTLTIAWHGLDLNVDGYNIYRSDAPMDPNNLPSPIASVGPNIGSYDDSSVVGGNTYYYRVGVIKGGSEVIGEEQKLFAGNFTLVSGSKDNTLKKIDSDGNEVWTFTGHTGRITSVDIDSNGNVYSGSFDNTVKKIDSSGNEVWTFNAGDRIWAVVKDLYNGYVYVGMQSGAIKKIDSDGNEVTSGGWPFTEHTSYIRHLDVDPDGYVYSASNDEKVRKIDSSGNEVWIFAGHTYAVNSVNVDFNNGYVYSTGGYSDETVRKLNIDDGSEVTSGGWPFSIHSTRVRDSAIDSNGYVYSVSWGGSIRKIDSNGNEVTSGGWPFTGHTGRITSVDIDSNGNVYSGSFDNTVKKIDSSGNEVWTFSEHTDYVYSVSVYQGY